MIEETFMNMLVNSGAGVALGAFGMWLMYSLLKMQLSPINENMDKIQLVLSRLCEKIDYNHGRKK
jgi:hypothetical protein